MLSVLRRNFLNPLSEFINDSRAIGIVLLACTVISLVVSNLPSGISYIAFWEMHVPLAESLKLPHTLLHWINDAAMTLFFFLAGMEIKREMVEGELASLRKSLLPVGGALGGMIAPAVIYILFTKGTGYIGGWGIPTATDIAFSLGLASLVGRKVPVGLKVFLTALAIIDDLGAIVVIALFYGEAVNLLYLLGCLVSIGAILLLNRAKMKFGFFHIVCGILLWYFMFNSGIHATVAGVIFALMVPKYLLTTYENKLHHPVYFIIMPLFALANTAIIFPEGGFKNLNGEMPWGIMIGLFLGKPLGIYLFCRVLVKSKLAALPDNVNWYKLIGAGILAGIGFTMSIFIATLAFSDKLHQDIAKIAVLLASTISMIVGFIWLYFAKRPPNPIIKDKE